MKKTLTKLDSNNHGNSVRSVCTLFSSRHLKINLYNVTNIHSALTLQGTFQCLVECLCHPPQKCSMDTEEKPRSLPASTISSKNDILIFHLKTILE